MNRLSPEQLLKHMELPSQRGIFVLGGLEQRVTLYSQQVRALNLVHALFSTGRLKKGQRMAVLGGGAAGLTAAAGAALRGCSVTLLEQMHTLLPIFQRSRKRLLHPHLYDWPDEDWDDARARLPVLDWSAGVASAVASQLLRGWEEVVQHHPLKLHLDAKDLELLPWNGSSYGLSWHAQQLHDDRFDIIILAVGFGIERKLQGVTSPSYWDDDSLDQPQRDPEHPLLHVLVSGTGDGGLVDLLRARLEGFEHESMVKDLLTNVPLAQTCKELLAIEERVRKGTLGDAGLHECYKQLPVAPAFTEHLQKRLRRDTEAVLNGLDPFPLSARASMLNRFLVSCLIRSKGGARYVQGKIQVQPDEAGGYAVTFQSGRRERFDRVIVRHGAQPALSAEHGFAWIDPKDLEHLRALNELDQTRFPLWPRGFFDAPTSGARPPPPSSTPAAAPGASSPHKLPPQGNNFGREQLKKQLVEVLLAEPPPPTTVLGPPGIGKSNLTIAALHDADIRRRYDPHRYFLHLDGVDTAAGLNSELAQALGLAPGPDLPARLETFFGGKPALLILDNAETPWEADPLATEQLLAELAAIPRLALLLSVRGRVQPALPRMGRPIEVPVLELQAARELFRSIAWDADLHHPRLDELLEAQQGLALAVNLLAHAAQGVDLDWTYKQWQGMRSGLLERPGAQKRLGSIAVSFELSLQSPRVTATARRLLSVSSKLPAGVARGDLDHIFPEDLEAPSVLSKAGLAFFEHSRLRVLAPIREYMQAKHPPTPDDWARAIGHYSKLAREQGPLVGTAKGSEAVERLADEVPNLDAVLLAELRSTEAREAIDTVLALNNFMRLSGYGSLDTLEQAREQAQRLGDMGRVAQSTYTLGQLLLRRSEHARARALFQEALPLFETLGDTHGRARCIQSIGSIALDDLDLEKAEDCFERAIPLREHLGDRQGVGNCLHGLGKVALGRHREEEARGYFNKALVTFEEAGSDLGRAHCLRSLGELDTRAHPLERARDLFKKVGDLKGMGHCLRGLANIALQEKQLERAGTLYQQALAVLRRVGSVRGVANCHLGMGYLARERGDTAAAQRAFEQALENYQRVGDKAHERECHQQLGRG